MKRIKLKKRKNKLRFRRKLVVVSTLVLFLMLGIGYSVLSVNLNILGNITVKKHYGNTLYEVLEKESDIGRLAREYTGEHHDSFTEEPSKKIYHWYAEDNTSGNNLANEIQDKYNVIFADHCWQMIRTTDTGGVKMIYNGEPENGQCLSTRENHVGYADVETKIMSTSYYYGISYIYDKTNNVFSLSDTVTTGTIQEGQYTCMNTDSNGTCEKLYYIDKLLSDTLYYVIPLNGNSHYSQFGKLEISEYDNSPSYMGYMYNTIHKYYGKQINKEVMTVNHPIITSYNYADSYNYDSNNNTYSLNNPFRISSSDEYSSLVGKYTFLNYNASSDKIYYIYAVKSSYMYVIEMSDGNNLAYYNHTYTYGDSYTDNGNGTYTISNPTTINRTDYFDNYNDLKNKYICKNANNNTCNELWLTPTTLNGTSLNYLSSNDIYKFANGFTYNSATNTYKLNNDQISIWNTNDEDNLESLKTHHYTCFTNSDECTTLHYAFLQKSDYGTVYYVDLDSGTSVEDVINQMFYADDVNTTNSTIKTGIDAWYKRYLYNYTSYLEDTIFCNNRVTTLGGFDPNGGNMRGLMLFGEFYASTNLSCTYETDKFSVSNNKAKLEYPVALITTPEHIIINNKNILKTGNNYWTMSPYEYDFVYSYRMYKTLNGCASITHSDIGVRPVISLKPGTEYVSGDGSMANPYVVSTS